MEDNNNKNDSVDADVEEVIFKYKKSNFYRVVHVNGAIGGVSGRGEIHVGLYSERAGFPDSGRLLISKSGQIGPEQFEGVGGHIREIEVDAVIDLNTAKELRAWLDIQIASIETFIKDAKKEAIRRAKQTSIPEN